MHKGKFLAILIASVLLVVGGVFLGIALKNNSFAGTYEDLTYAPEESFTNIKIESNTVANCIICATTSGNGRIKTIK